MVSRIHGEIITMKVLVACEFSQVVTNEFTKLGHNAYSCDLLPTDGNSNFHIQGDVLDHLNENWDLLIAHPACTFICNSSVWALHKDPSRWNKLDKATEFFNRLQNCNIPKICIENPIPHKYAVEKIGKYTQIVQPWMFGEDASKATCLWLKNLPLLIPTNVIKKKRYANQTPTGQNKLGPSKDRWKLRSVTYQGIAAAMAEQWTVPAPIQTKLMQGIN